MSLSARRAWIEIESYKADLEEALVALRKESVDRNILEICHSLAIVQSLSARRAWIEISSLISSNIGNSVALRKESVDRNISYIESMLSDEGRSPQGERG